MFDEELTEDLERGVGIELGWVGDTEEQRLEALRKFERQTKDFEFEVCHVVRPDGTVFRKAGWENRVDHTYEEIATFKGGIYTHNHRRSEPPSHFDVLFARAADLAEFRTVSRRTGRVTRILRPERGWPEDRQVILNRFNDAYGDALEEIAPVPREPFNKVRVRKFFERLKELGIEVERL